ncbi:MAG: NmrA family NAD(P)-binding protein [Candidatus Acidiferrales bacterium]
MNNLQRIIVVAGARGNLGKLICDALLSRARTDGRPVLVRGLVRKSSAHAASADAPASPADRQLGIELAIEPVDYHSDDDLNRVCAGAYCVVSALQGLEDVIVGVQSRLLNAAIKAGARRFIPSDYSLDITKLPVGANRNFDLRLIFHQRAAEIIRQSNSTLEFTSIFQGAFMELLGTGWVLFDYKKRRVTYLGSPDTVMEFTTIANTAEFTAAVAMDPNPTPSKLLIAGAQLTAKQAQDAAKRVTGVDFGLKRLMSVGMIRRIIGLMRFFKPGKKDEVMPMWVRMQYGYCMALGVASPGRLDNDRYQGLRWTGPDEVIRKAFDAEVARERRQ